MSDRCKGKKNSDGKPCNNYKQVNSNYCRFHKATSKKRRTSPSRKTKVVFRFDKDINLYGLGPVGCAVPDDVRIPLHLNQVKMAVLLCRSFQDEFGKPGDFTETNQGNKTSTVTFLKEKFGTCNLKLLEILFRQIPVWEKEYKSLKEDQQGNLVIEDMNTDSLYYKIIKRQVKNCENDL